MRDTIVAAATAPGAGALAVLRLGGGAALETARGFLRPRGGVFEPRRAVLSDARSRDELVDEVVATYFPAASSPTGEDLVEVSCHGSPYIVERLQRAALDNGARAALPGEFTQRAYLNGKLDLAQAEAVCDLIAARTAEAHRAALSQLSGGLSKEIAKLRAPILELVV
ncbi:MAG: tRNA uridine-5-carboxymethylaminomethyl(34) synthesis GTPase MnmE, partial [Elusimicrobia bacterium]|nr:tRNA uridine-5-carboxymethylaminomethyl(34) synthesis GTPase MnmE [Elusimicrobiota bacterium]